MNWWDLLVKILLIVITLGIGAIAFFLRRLVSEFDALRKSQQEEHDSVCKARNIADDAVRRVDKLESNLVAFHEGHTKILQTIQREMLERYVRRDDFQDAVISRIGKSDQLLHGISSNVSAILASLSATDTRLKEGEERFARHEKELRDLHGRVSTIEGRTTAHDG